MQSSQLVGDAFAALKSDGSITTWGDPSSGAPTN
jgi:hypothetical protein